MNWITAAIIAVIAIAIGAYLFLSAPPPADMAPADMSPEAGPTGEDPAIAPSQ